MATPSDQELALARVYSAAILELAEAKGEADSLLAELLDLSAYLAKDPEFDAFFRSPMLDPEAREKSIERIFRGKASDLLVDSLQVLNRKGRLDLFRSIAETYRLSHQGLRGRAEVRVTTAVPLNKKLRARIKGLADAYTGKDAVLVETLDESILGGMIVRIGDQKLDGSITARLRKLGESLVERASRQLYGGASYVTE